MLEQLGINHTAAIQFIIYVVTLTALVFLVYSPFAVAYIERRNRTKGTETVGWEQQKKTIELQAEFQKKAREVNSKISEIYRQVKNEASLECDKIVGQAKQESQEKLDENRKKIVQSVDQAAKDLSTQTTKIALLITNKLLGKQ